MNARSNRARRKNLEYTFEDAGEKNKAYQKNLRESRKAQGLCIWCGKPRSKYSSCFCLECRLKNQRKNEKRYREQYGVKRVERPDYGLCYICGSPIEYGRTCERCKANSRSNLPQFNEGWYSYHKQMNQALFGN